MNHQAKAESAYSTVLQHFYVPEARLFREHSPSQRDDRPFSYLWPFVGVLSTTNAMLGLVDTQRPYLSLLQDLLASLEQYWQAPGYQSYVVADGGGQRYYDDNAWIGMELLAAYRILKDRRLLDRAQALFDFVMSGWSDEMGGGIYWREGDLQTKNTCSNGPGAVLGLQLYQATGDPRYLQAAQRLFDWTNAHLRAPDGLYWDSVDRRGNVDTATFTYNTGIMLQAHLLLYQITRSEKYYQDAVQIAQRSVEYFASPTGSLRFFPATPWFNAVLFRAYLDFRSVTGDGSYAGLIVDGLEYGWEHARDDSGLLRADWSNRRSNRPYAQLLDQAPVAEIYALAAGLHAGQDRRPAAGPRKQTAIDGFASLAAASWQPSEGLAALSPLGTRGYRAHFSDHGAYWSDATGSVTLSGAVYVYYEQSGGPSGPLGFPVADAVPASSSPLGTSGYCQRFEGSQNYNAQVLARLAGVHSGAAVYWAPGSGPFTTTYEIGSCYESFGGPGGELGYPTSERFEALPSPQGTAGLSQRYEGGSIYWSQPYGAHPVVGAISACYEGLGGTTGRLGFPVTDVSGDVRPGSPGDVTRQRFEGGWITWRPGHDAQASFD